MGAHFVEADAQIKARNLHRPDARRAKLKASPRIASCYIDTASLVLHKDVRAFYQERRLRVARTNASPHSTSSDKRRDRDTGAQAIHGQWEVWQRHSHAWVTFPTLLNAQSVWQCLPCDPEEEWPARLWVPQQALDRLRIESKLGQTTQNRCWIGSQVHLKTIWSWQVLQDCWQVRSRAQKRLILAHKRRP